MKKYDEEFIDIITSMLMWNIKDRPNFLQLKENLQNYAKNI